ncbi:MAG: IPT/TIG domain-containing protein, partial [Promethearchaeia archaeon]
DGTELTLTLNANGAFDTNNVAAGTKVYFALGANAFEFQNHVANSCVKKMGSARTLQDPDKDFRIVTIRVKTSATANKIDTKVYIDGLHDGCEKADGCTLTAPIELTGGTPVDLEHLRLGMMAAAPADNTASATATSVLAGAIANHFANVDIAEMLIYKTALSVEEMDRIGNYLSVKFNLPGFKANDFLRSPTRSMAVSAKWGCDKTLFRTHESKLCDGFPACPDTTTLANVDSLTLSRELADADTDDYYNGMRLYITGGGASNDGTKLSAKGQSCRITDYTAAHATTPRSAACDLTNQGQFGYVLWGGNFLGCNGATDAVSATDQLLTVSWVPAYMKTPYYAAIGADDADREIVKVLSVAIVGNQFQLTVIRGFAGANAGVVTWANSKALAAAAKITYASSALMNVNTATSLLVAGFLKSCTDKSDTRCAIASDGLPTATLANLYVKITKKTPTTETKAITALAKQTFTLKGGSAAADIAGATGMAIDDTFDTIKKKTGDDFGDGAVALPKLYKAADLLLIGNSLADGEVVYVKADATAADTLTIVRGMPLPVSLAAAGRKSWTLAQGISNTDTSITLTTAMSATDVPAGALLLLGTLDTTCEVSSAGAYACRVTEVVKAGALSNNDLTLAITRDQGYKLSDGAARTGVKVAVPAGTTVTLLTKIHAEDDTMTRIGLDGEPLLFATTAAASVQAPAEGITIDVGIAPLGGAAYEGKAYAGGSGISTYKIEQCDKYLPPFFADAPIQIVQGNEYLKSPGAGVGGSFTADTGFGGAVLSTTHTNGNAFWMSADGVTASTATGPATAPASGGTTLELKGWYLGPTDLNIEGDTAESQTAGATVERNENYLLVTVGARPSQCADPTQTTPCADGKYENREAALSCNIVEVPGGFCEDDWTIPCKCKHGVVCDGGAADKPCADGKKCFAGPAKEVGTGVHTDAYGTGTTWYATSKPSMRCALPGTLNANQDLNIYWHGVKTTFSNWYRPHAPVVTKLVPSSAIYSGGDTVTVMGSNFGPKDVWTAVNKAGTKTVTTRTATISFVGKGMAKMCDTLVYVSDKQLICKVPALANQKQDMDKAA